MVNGRRYSRDTANKIRACIRKAPGIKAREIAQIIGRTRRTVNSYLYGSRPGALRHEVYQDGNYGWHLQEDNAVPRRVNRPFPAAPGRQNSQPKVNPQPFPQPIFSREVDLTRNVTVSVGLIEAFRGTQKTVYVDNRVVTVDIPAKTRPGSQIRVPNGGAYDPATGRRGDLNCWVNLASDKALRLESDDVIYAITISHDLAKQGGAIDVPSVDGIKSIRVPAGIRSGQRLQLRGIGWTTDAGSRGDQFIIVTVVAAERSPTPIPQPEPTYSPETVQRAFAHEDYTSLSDDEQGKLAEMLQKIELEQRQSPNLVPSQNRQPLAVLASGWFWLAIVMGGVVTYGGLQLFPQLIPSSPQPTEQPSP